MPKVLCMAGAAISVLVFVLFLLDLVGPEVVAPFKGANRVMDIVYIVSSGIVGYLSWSTLREQK